MAHWIRCLLRRFVHGESRNEATVDLSDLGRKRAIQEFEYQQQCAEGSRVLRVSGKVPAPVLCIKAITVRKGSE